MCLFGKYSFWILTLSFCKLVGKVAKVVLHKRGNVLLARAFTSGAELCPYLGHSTTTIREHLDVQKLFHSSIQFCFYEGQRVKTAPRPAINKKDTTPFVD